VPNTGKQFTNLIFNVEDKDYQIQSSIMIQVCYPTIQEVVTDSKGNSPPQPDFAEYTYPQSGHPWRIKDFW